MSSPTNEFDYDEIVKQLIKKDIVSEKLDDEKNVLDEKRWAALRSYYEAKGKFELAKNDNNVAKAVYTEKSKMRSNIDHEHSLLHKKLLLLEELHTEIKTKSVDQSEAFVHEMDTLYDEFKKLPAEFDNENMHLTIANLKKLLDSYQLKIGKVNEEKEALTSSLENFESPCDLSDLNVLTENIQKESLAMYGDPKKIQHRLSEVRRNNEALRKKIQDIKIKFGI